MHNEEQGVWSHSQGDHLQEHSVKLYLWSASDDQKFSEEAKEDKNIPAAEVSECF